MNNTWDEFIKEVKNTKDLSKLCHLVNDYERAYLLQNLLIGTATSGTTAGSNNEYELLRGYFLYNQNTKDILPLWVRTHRDLSQFWQFIKYKYKTYDERQLFIWSEFSKILSHLESGNTCPANDNIDEVLLIFDSETIHRYWRKALERKNQDPDGAITIARTLLESICKHILDLQNIEYNSKNIDLSELYKKTASSLKLHASQHEEEIFKQILGGCSAIINGLGNLRNNLGDSHGTSRVKRKKPASRHSELAVNLAGSMALFLIQTFENRTVCI